MSLPIADPARAASARFAGIEMSAAVGEHPTRTADDRFNSLYRQFGRA
ncbi:hypothetical protein [Sphingomonas sp. 3-13AW]